MTSRTCTKTKFWTLSSLHVSAYQPQLKRKATSTNKQKGSKQRVKKTVPNMTDVACEMISDADRDAILAESGMEPSVPSTSGTMSEIIDRLKKERKKSGVPPFMNFVAESKHSWHSWSEEENDTLWSYVEKFHLQLYHGKDNMTHPQVLTKITTLLSTCSIFVNAPVLLLLLHYECLLLSFSLGFIADTHLDLNLNRKQVDDKLYHIERRFKAREAARHSGAADQSEWLLEDRIIPILGKKCQEVLEDKTGCSLHRCEVQRELF